MKLQDSLQFFQGVPGKRAANCLQTEAGKQKEYDYSGSLVAAIQNPAQTARAASLLIALEVVLHSFGIYGSAIFLLLIILSAITSVVWWRQG